MDEQLRQRKQIVRERFLGKNGIHGVGMRVKEGVVCVYVSDERNLQAETRQSIEAAAAPFKLRVIQEEAPRIQLDATDLDDRS